MRVLDIFSESPKNYIFQKVSNKSNFGGFLCIIFIIIMFLINLTYWLDYCLNDKFEIQYSNIMKEMSIEESREINKKEDYNPYLEFGFELYNADFSSPLSQNFLLYNFKNGEIINGRIIKTRPSDLDIGIMYFCNENEDDSNCTLKEEDKITLGSYNILIKYNGFLIDHESDKGIIKNETIILYNYYPFFFNYTLIRNLIWENIIYKDEKGISRLFDIIKGEKDEIIGGHIASSDSYFFDRTLKKSEYNSIKFLGEIKIKNDHMNQIEIKRRIITPLDVISKLSALFSFFHFIFHLIIKYYSNNFDNYKIIEKILKARINTKEIELNKIINNHPKEIVDQKYLNNNKNDNNSTPLIKDDNNTQDLIINDIDNIFEDNEINDDYEYNKNLGKLRFYDYFLNNISFCKCFNSIKSQQKISLCNEIISKYISIDYIIYNEMKLENLFKDYKWNNPQLNKIDNNELFIKLKNI